MDAIKEAMIREEDTGIRNPQLDNYRDAEKLDPLFGAATGKELMFELRLSVIECEIARIAQHVDVLWFKEWFRASQAASLARYDMPRTIQKMRDAADRLEKLTGAKPGDGEI